MPFGRLFGTKLGGVLVWRRGSSLDRFVEAAAAASGAEERVFLSFFLEIQKGR